MEETQARTVFGKYPITAIFRNVISLKLYIYSYNYMTLPEIDFQLCRLENRKKLIASNCIIILKIFFYRRPYITMVKFARQANCPKQQL